MSALGLRSLAPQRDRSPPKFHEVQRSAASSASEARKRQRKKHSGVQGELVPLGKAGNAVSQRKNTAMTKENMKGRIDIVCPFCKATFRRSKEREEKKQLLFCAYCGAHLKPEAAAPGSSETNRFSSVYVEEHRPNTSDIQGSIGQYLLLKTLAKGGMGEIFLAYDTISGRQVALKRIRPDFLSTPLLKQRFLKEARITSQLIHPSIIPIYNIHIEGDLVYYTMPYVQGQTLRQLLNEVKTEEEEGKSSHTSHTSLIRIFLSITQAIAYAHSREILHRDIKPENIIIGQYGQVIILDWGLTKLIEENEVPIPELQRDPSLTRVGKLVGTVAYMAPERAKERPASIKTDIYALGVILYQILTLTLPFKRKSISHFLESIDHEQYTPPEIRAPYRDIPSALSALVRACLENEPSKRIQSCDAIVEHLENFLEGKSEWFFVQSLQLDKKKDWEVQENILFSDYTSLLNRHESSDWHRLMISSQSFPDNVRVRLTLTLQKGSQGIGILLAVPNESEREALTDGYCFWLSSEKESEQGTMILRSSVIVFEAPDILLNFEKQYEIAIEKTDQSFVLYRDGIEVLRYMSHIPLIGSHVGLLVKDGFFSLDAFEVSIGSQNIMVNCLAVPDAFLAARAYDKAYLSYNRLSELFSGRTEGREAIFRAGIALLEMGKHETDPEERAHLFHKSLAQFQKLRNTPGAPLEYLGKTYVYQATKEYEEEAKCFEVAFRRYPFHPYLWMLHEQLTVRLHELSKTNRVAASHFIVLALRFLPEKAARISTKRLLAQSTKEWEWPYYFPFDESEKDTKELILLSFAFWLRLVYIAQEQLNTFLNTPILPKTHIETAFLTLKALDHEEEYRNAIKKCKSVLSSDEALAYEDLFYVISESENSALALIANKIQKTDTLNSLYVRAGLVLMDLLLQKDPSLIQQELLCLLAERAPPIPSFSARLVELFFTKEKYEEGFLLLQQREKEGEVGELSPLFFLKGCYVAKQEGEQKAIELFQAIGDLPYPPSWAIACHVIGGKISLRPKGWVPRAYSYEMTTLERHLRLFSRITSHNWLSRTVS